MNAFVRPPAEVERLSQALARPWFEGGQSTSVTVRTTEEFVRSVLPPGLSPPESPQLTIAVNVFGSGICGPFSGGSIRVAAVSDGGVNGHYVLRSYMSTDAAVIYGRETLGEPKRLGMVRYFRANGRVHATVERDGALLLSLSARPLLVADPGAGSTNRTDFNYRMSLAPDGSGPEGPTRLIVSESTSQSQESFVADAELTMGSGRFDQLGGIPVLDALDARISTGVSVTVRHVETILVDSRSFLAHAFGRYSDWPLAAPVHRGPSL